MCSNIKTNTFVNRHNRNMHKPAPVLANDSERVAFLRSLNILDTEAASAFDRITEAASTITHSPIALVSLVDSDRQWFKSKVGLSVSETSRDLAFCSHVIAENDCGMFVVSDALEDERFKYSALVLGGPRIRFYAGVPLVVSDANGRAHKIGTLCIIDRTPRQVEDYHRVVMQTLAELVVSEIDKLRPTHHSPSGWNLVPVDEHRLHSEENWAGALPTWSCCEQAAMPCDDVLLSPREAEAMWTDLLRHPQSAPASFDRLCQQRNNGEASTRWDAPYDGDSDGTWSRASSGMDCDEL